MYLHANARMLPASVVRMPAQTPLVELRIGFNPGVDLPASLAPLGRWGDDGLDRWDGQRLLRTVRMSRALVPYDAVVSPATGSPALTVAIPAQFASRLAEVADEVQSMLIEPPASLAALADEDPEVDRLRRLYPGSRPLLWPDPLSALIRSISAQQVNLRWAATVRRRIAERYGTRHVLGDEYVYSLEAEPLAESAVEDLRALQLTTAKARSVIAVGQASASGELERPDLERLDDDALIAHLTRLKGIGLWSAEWFLARTLGRPRVVAGDLGVRKAVARMYRTGGMPSEGEVRRLTAHWRDSATFVQALALHDLAVAPAGT